jgi:hypothetical protein
MQIHCFSLAQQQPADGAALKASHSQPKLLVLPCAGTFQKAAALEVWSAQHEFCWPAKQTNTGKSASLASAGKSPKCYKNLEEQHTWGFAWKWLISQSIKLWLYTCLKLGLFWHVSRMEGLSGSNHKNIGGGGWWGFLAQTMTLIFKKEQPSSNKDYGVLQQRGVAPHLTAAASSKTSLFHLIFVMAVWVVLPSQCTGELHFQCCTNSLQGCPWRILPTFAKVEITFLRYRHAV